ncbi:MAG: hypothetical protein QG635_156 [Bacteroidota bacterium]|nr:hypothetical protein [Bacteroidota bacterium]
MNEVIRCPKCGYAIELSDALKNQLEDKLRLEFREKYMQEMEKFRFKARKEAEETAALRIKEFELVLEEKNKRIKEFDEQALELRQKQRLLEDKEKMLDETVRQKLEDEKKSLAEKIMQQAKDNIKLEMLDLQKQLEEKNSKLTESQNMELEFRRKQRELEEAQQNQKIEFERRIDEERKKIIDSASEKLSEEYRLKELEKNKQIDDMKKTIEELKRKSEQGSQQTQGEVLELEIENMLRTAYPYDIIMPVPKGVRGGDVMQQVRLPNGSICGTIIWEAKRTKNWTPDWIPKLKEDRIAAKADLAALVSVVLPKDITHIGVIDDVWVSGTTTVKGLADLLRLQIIEVSIVKKSLEGRTDKLDLLYNYITGQEFRQKMQAILETYITMKEELETERRSLTNIWSKRDKQLDRLTLNTSSIYGDLQSIIGGEIEAPQQLALPE